MNGVRTAILIGLIPIDDLRARWRETVLTGQHEGAIAACCLSLRIAPDSADFVLNLEMVLDQVEQA
jgi:hypothetical protein